MVLLVDVLTLANVLERVANCLEFVGILEWDLEAELVLKRHHDLDLEYGDLVEFRVLEKIQS